MDLKQLIDDAFGKRNLEERWFHFLEVPIITSRGDTRYRVNIIVFAAGVTYPAKEVGAPVLYVMGTEPESWLWDCGPGLRVWQQRLEKPELGKWNERDDGFYLDWVKEWVGFFHLQVARGAAKAAWSYLTEACRPIYQGDFSDLGQLKRDGWQTVLEYSDVNHPRGGDLCGHYIENVYTAQVFKDSTGQLRVTCPQARVENGKLDGNGNKFFYWGPRGYALVGLRKSFCDWLEKRWQRA